MRPLGLENTIVVRGVTLRGDPAREKCFTIRHLHTELRLSNDSSEVSRREALHRDVNSEIQSLEIAAQSLVDFPEAPWDLRMQLARQCWDETRHARLFYRQFVGMGGRKGEFPIANHEWGVVCMLDSLPGRLAIQNRTFEAGSLDGFTKLIGRLRVGGQDSFVEFMETVIMDEIQHVRFANQWLRRMIQEDPRVTLKVAAAIDHVRRVNVALAPQPGEVDIEGKDYSAVDHSVRTNSEDRSHADFTEEEIGEIRRKASLV